MGDNSDPSQVICFPFTQSLPPQISPASCLQPTGVDSGPREPQPQSMGPGFPHSLLIIFYKSNATQFFSHYREPWGG